MKREITIFEIPLINYIFQLFQTLYRISNTIGAGFDYIYPLSVYRVNGLCRLIGKDYGPGFAVLFYIFSL